MCRAILAIILTLSLTLTHASAKEDPLVIKLPPEIRVLLAVPQQGVFVLENDDSHLDVIIENISPNPLKLYDSWNSWGYFTVRLDWESNGKKDTIQFAQRAWQKNFASTTEIPPGAAIIRPISIGKDCEGWPTLTQGMKLTVTAIYESTGKGPSWQGKESSAPITLQIEDRRKN